MNDVQTLRVEQVMTPAPVCLDGACTLAGALAFLVREHHQAAPVVDEDGGLLGVVTRATLLARLATVGALRGDRRVEELLDEPIDTVLDASPPRCGPTATLKDVSRLLSRAHHPALLVVEGERLVGIVTLRDVVRAMAYGDELAADEVVDETPLHLLVT